MGTTKRRLFALAFIMFLPCVGMRSTPSIDPAMLEEMTEEERLALQSQYQRTMMRTLLTGS